MHSFEQMLSDETEKDSVEEKILELVDEQFKYKAAKRLSARQGSLRQKLKAVARLIMLNTEMDRRRVLLNRKIVDLYNSDDYAVPTWPPASDFNFPVADIPIVTQPIKDMKPSYFYHVKHLATGSSGTAFLAKYRGTQVVVKVLREEVKDDLVCLREFDMELGLLARINHPNIEKVLGFGVAIDRKFIVLQCLGGGTMQHRFNAAAAAKKRSFFGGRSTFSFPEVFFYARQLAGALNYLHNEIHPDAVFIHRDLKPDNIAFLEDGNLILFDLGLTTVVKRGATSDVAYQMTGETGSVRFMAPEVALDRPYNEKVDQYAFGVILWEMAKDDVPFLGASRASYIQYVCVDGERPTMPFNWPADLKHLIDQCWHQEHQQRPSFVDVCVTLDNLVERHPR